MANTLLFNKPYNVLCQFTDGQTANAEKTKGADQKRQCLADFIQVSGVYAAGRLDRDSEGLLVLTDDGALNQKITHPSRKMSKTYWVQVEGAPNAQDLQPLLDGMVLKDGPCLPVSWVFGRQPLETTEIWSRQPPIRQRKNIPTTWLTLTLKEGRNRQVRRMCAGLGFPVLRLIRYRIGSWTIDGIAPGQSVAI
jgi:23S rRNA pseudouridine2457 synthase